MEERKRRIAAEEASRLALDEAFREEEKTRRAAALQKAKWQLYIETDPVKALHSKINEMQTIEVVLTNKGA